MLKFLLLIVYLYNGQVKLDQISTPSRDACVDLANKRLPELVKDPRTDDIYWVGCAEVQVTEVKR